MQAVRAQDVVVAAGMLALRDADGPQSQLARLLEVPRSRVSESMRRLEENGLFSRSLGSLRSARLLDLLVHGLPWMFPAVPGELAWGVPMSHSGPVLSDVIASSQPFVWPCEGGTTQGKAVEPIHATVLKAARSLPLAYEVLSLADSVRVGRVREKRLAAEALERILRS